MKKIDIFWLVIGIIFLILVLIYLCFVFFITRGYYESMKNLEKKQSPSQIDLSFISHDDVTSGFCDHHEGSSDILEKSCNQLTNGNCNLTRCCVWTSESKCVAGNAKGPTYHTGVNNDYYYQNKCYGDKCK